MHFVRTHALCALALAAAGSAACSSEPTKSLPVETLRAAVARHVKPGGEVGTVPEPTSYRLELVRYIKDSTGDDVIGEGDDARQALAGARFVRRIIRPFNESGAVTRTLGFAREQGTETSRVVALRPLPDDGRPRVYAPEQGSANRRIAGRNCVLFKVGDEDLCVDEAGLVLLRRDKTTAEIATKVTIDDKIRSPEQLAASLRSGFTDVNRGSVRPIHPDSAPPGTDYSLDRVPDGFTLVGRYAVAPLSAEILARNSRKVTAGIVDVYVRGIDSLVIERGGKLDLGTVGDEDLGSLGSEHVVDVTPHGTGSAGIGGVGAFGYREVRFFPQQGRYVVVAGTLPEAELVAITRALKTFPGTTLQYLDTLKP